MEAIFLVDCSGSMSGQSMNVSWKLLICKLSFPPQLAKEALGLFLHSLPTSCHFNIFIFGSSFQSLFPNR